MDNQNGNERLPSNSYMSKSGKRPEEKKVEKVASGKIVQRKKSLGEKFSETFLATDMSSVVEHIFFDVLIPAAKDTISDIVEGAINMMLFGSRRGGRTTRRSDGRSRIYTSYDRMYDDRERRVDPKDRDRDGPVRGRSRNAVEDVVFPSKAEAEDVLDNLRYLIEKYGVASVKDYYRFADLKSDYTKETYGWFNLEDADVARIREGWLLRLPKPVVIDE